MKNWVIVMHFKFFCCFPHRAVFGDLWEGSELWGCTFVKVHSPVKELEPSKVIARQCQGEGEKNPTFFANKCINKCEPYILPKVKTILLALYLHNG